ncbi:cytochrome c oxidase subunit NDUFA4-like [Oncorhynchus nerka]|uniref:cytochrome c oxidase subunit NDUFA4-like n=1 Tax=Oncorhynchus tshawytscha TaxID=74940 RepID=UPI000D09F8A6|nr:cytochrome c oxidase subunit NDUFA4-like [Oncorhynchus tshawytscha]
MALWLIHMEEDRERRGITTTETLNPSVLLPDNRLDCLTKGPHISWNRKNNPDPWNTYGPHYQYKLVAVNMDYKALKKEGPDF